MRHSESARAPSWSEARRRGHPPRTAAPADFLPGSPYAVWEGRRRASLAWRHPAARSARRSAERGCRRRSRDVRACAALSGCPRQARARGYEVHRHEPGTAVARGWRRQRNEAAGDGRELLAGRQHDGLAADGDRQASGDRVFARLKPNRRARSSTANISWPLSVRAASGRRPSRERTV